MVRAGLKGITDIKTEREALQVTSFWQLSQNSRENRKTESASLMASAVALASSFLLLCITAQHADCFLVVRFVYFWPAQQKPVDKKTCMALWRATIFLLFSFFCIATKMRARHMAFIREIYCEIYTKEQSAVLCVVCRSCTDDVVFRN